jgi:hypothetical protein
MSKDFTANRSLVRIESAQAIEHKAQVCEKSVDFIPLSLDNTPFGGNNAPFSINVWGFGVTTRSVKSHNAQPPQNSQAAARRQEA